jgi:hypothetical protein
MRVFTVVVLLSVLALTSLAQDTLDTRNSTVDPNNELIESKPTYLTGGLYKINIINNTPYRVNFFVDKKFAFCLSGQSDNGAGKNSIKGYTIKGEVVMYARTKNQKLQWGPIKLDRSMEGFTWNINE